MENGIQNAESQLQKKKERPLGSTATLLGILVGVLEMLYAFISALKGIVLVLDNFRNSADHAPISYIYLFVIAIADFTLGIYLLVFLTRGRILSSQKKSPFKILTLSLLGMHATAAFISLFRMCCFGFKASSVILLNEHIAGIILAVLAFLQWNPKNWAPKIFFFISAGLYLINGTIDFGTSFTNGWWTFFYTPVSLLVIAFLVLAVLSVIYEEKEN